jgi:protein phosphatase 1 regulatory subunit 7
LANNKLKNMAGLKGLTQLRKIDLGANRIRVMEDLDGLVNLEELWLGKNKIEKIQGLDQLVKLRRLDVQSNRLECVENLTSCQETLEELFLGHNGITSDGASTPTGLSLAFPKLTVLDLSRNRLTNTKPFGHLKSLDELWLSGNKICTFDDVQPLAALGNSLETVYLEYNPLQQDPLYRKKLAEMIPGLKQIDANMIGGLAAHGIPSAPSSSTMPASDEERLRQLQHMAIARAQAETDQQKQQQQDN